MKKNVSILSKTVLVALAVVLLVLCAIPSYAEATDPVGWKVVFTINGCQGDVTVGANDNGSGFHMFPIAGNVNAGLAGGYGSQIHSGATTSFSELLSITPTAAAPKMFDLNWSTYNWEPIGLYQPGNLWPMFNVSGVLVEGNDITVLDLNRSGSVTLMAGYESQLTILANPVPEPSSILALMTGFAGLVGFVRRRR